MNTIAKAWTIPDSPPPDPGCFVIPSYALVDRRFPTRPTIAQIELAYQWWKRYPQAKLIMSRGISAAGHVLEELPPTLKGQPGMKSWCYEAARINRVMKSSGCSYPSARPCPYTAD